MRPYLSAKGVAELRTRLSDRDCAIVQHVATLKLMSAPQVQAVHFPASDHGSAAAATRARQRVVARLCHERLLAPLQRRIGGIRAGSQGLIVAAGPAAGRVLRLPGTRRRQHEPGLRFVEHTLAISQLMVDVTLASRAGQCDLLDWQVEPGCWRTFAGSGGWLALRPDACLSLGVDAWALDWFIEVDRATESLPTILRKCRLYFAYYQSGSEQATAARGGVFPRVCWIVPDQPRAERLRTAIAQDHTLPERLFVVTTDADALAALTATNVTQS
jgi:Replication-relaxation